MARSRGQPSFGIQSEGREYEFDDGQGQRYLHLCTALFVDVNNFLHALEH